MRCRQCGHEIDTSHRFCAFCGAEWMADAGRAAPHDEGAARDLHDDKASFLTGEEMFFALDDDAIDDDLVFSSYDNDRRPIRWVPIAVSLLSVLLLAGLIIGIWMQFFSEDREDTEFSDPTQPTYNLVFSPQRQDQESTTPFTTESGDFTQETTSTTTTTTESTTDTEPTTQPTTTPPSAEVVVVTDPPTTTPPTTTPAVTDPPTTTPPTTTAIVTDPPTTTPRATTPPVTQPSATGSTETVPVPTSGAAQETTLDETESVTTPEFTSPSTVTTTPTTPEEETETTESQPQALLSIDNVHMDMWPGVRLHFSYAPPQTTPSSEPGEASSETEEPSTTSEPTVPDDGSKTDPSVPVEESPGESSIPPPFDIRFLSVFESETEDGAWTKQFVTEEKSVSKLLIVAETSQAMTKTLSIEVLRSSLTAFVESMDFVDEESDRKGDALGLMHFSDSETVLSEVTGNKQEVLDAISKLEEGADESALWKSLYLAFDHTPDYGAIILITKGEDTGVMLPSLYVWLMANQKGIPIYTVLLKTNESALPLEKEEEFRQFSEITGGCCYVIDMTNPETDVAVSMETALMAAYGGDRQNSFVFYESTTRAEAATRFVKIVYAPEGQEIVESEIVTYSIPTDTEDFVPETRHHTSEKERRIYSGRREREVYS